MIVKVTDLQAELNVGLIQATAYALQFYNKWYADMVLLVFDETGHKVIDVRPITQGFKDADGNQDRELWYEFALAFGADTEAR